MSLHANFNRVNSFLLNLECLGRTGRTDAFLNECIETGGTYINPTQAPGATHLFEIDLHEICASGMSDEEVQRNWIKLARNNVPETDRKPYATIYSPIGTPILVAL